MMGNKEQSLSSAIDQVQGSLSDQQLDRLNAVRANAMATVPSKGQPWYVMTGVAASLALVAVLWLPVGGPSTMLDQPMVADKDLVENLEFYAWLAEQPSEQVN